MNALPDLVRAFLAASRFRDEVRGTRRTDPLVTDLALLAETSYSVAATQIMHAVAAMPGDAPVLYEALVTAWREATHTAPSREHDELCKGIVAGALTTRAVLVARFGSVVDAFSTEKPRGDA